MSVCREGVHTERGLPVPLSRFVCPGFVLSFFFTNAPLLSRAISELSNSLFLNPESERKRRAKEEEWGEHDLRGGRNRERVTVRLHIRRFLSLRLPNLAPFRLPGSLRHLAHFTARRRAGFGFLERFREGGAPFLSCVKPQERGGWLASKKRNSLFSLHCGRDSHGELVSFPLVCFPPS